MKILFCGTQVPEEIEYQVRDISAAGNRFQNNLCFNLRKCGHEVEECAYIGVPVPEKVRDKLRENAVLKEDGFLRSLLVYRRKLLNLLNDSDVVICYNITYAWLFLPLWARRRHKKCIAIIADYSETVSYASILGKLYAFFQGASMRRFDKIVGLSANMRGKLGKNQSFILMEGGIDRKLYDAFHFAEHVDNMPITFLYSGLLGEVTGVDKLLGMMKKIKSQDIRLLISGKGTLEETIKKAEKEDPRICFLGHLPYDSYIELLNKADVLLNPRNMELPENLNNFPSKIMDYLAAGKIIISTKFAGWENFREYIMFCDDYEEMASLAENIHLENERERFDRNRRFAQTFLWEKQMAKILN